MRLTPRALVERSAARADWLEPRVGPPRLEQPPRREHGPARERALTFLACLSVAMAVEAALTGGREDPFADAGPLARTLHARARRARRLVAAAACATGALTSCHLWLAHARTMAATVPSHDATPAAVLAAGYALGRLDALRTVAEGASLLAVPLTLAACWSSAVIHLRLEREVRRVLADLDARARERGLRP